MRVRTIIREMEAGNPDAWKQAEVKLSKSDVHERNKQALVNAMCSLPDPRKSEEN